MFIVALLVIVQMKSNVHQGEKSRNNGRLFCRKRAPALHIHSDMGVAQRKKKDVEECIPRESTDTKF